MPEVWFRCHLLAFALFICILGILPAHADPIRSLSIQPSPFSHQDKLLNFSGLVESSDGFSIKDTLTIEYSSDNSIQFSTASVLLVNESNIVVGRGSGAVDRTALNVINIDWDIDLDESITRMQIHIILHTSFLSQPHPGLARLTGGETEENQHPHGAYINKDGDNGGYNGGDNDADMQFTISYLFKSSGNGDEDEDGNGTVKSSVVVDPINAAFRTAMVHTSCVAPPIFTGHHDSHPSRNPNNNTKRIIDSHKDDDNGDNDVIPCEANRYTFIITFNHALDEITIREVNLITTIFTMQSPSDGEQTSGYARRGDAIYVPQNTDPLDGSQRDPVKVSCLVNGELTSLQFIPGSNTLTFPEAAEVVVPKSGGLQIRCQSNVILQLLDEKDPNPDPDPDPDPDPELNTSAPTHSQTQPRVAKRPPISTPPIPTSLHAQDTPQTHSTPHRINKNSNDLLTFASIHVIAVPRSASDPSTAVATSSAITPPLSSPQLHTSMAYYTHRSAASVFTSSFQLQFPEETKLHPDDSLQLTCLGCSPSYISINATIHGVFLKGVVVYPDNNRPGMFPPVQLYPETYASLAVYNLHITAYFPRNTVLQPFQMQLVYRRYNTDGEAPPLDIISRSNRSRSPGMNANDIGPLAFPVQSRLLSRLNMHHRLQLNQSHSPLQSTTAITTTTPPTPAATAPPAPSEMSLSDDFAYTLHTAVLDVYPTYTLSTSISIEATKIIPPVKTDPITSSFHIVLESILIRVTDLHIQLPVNLTFYGAFKVCYINGSPVQATKLTQDEFGRNNGLLFPGFPLNAGMNYRITCDDGALRAITGDQVEFENILIVSALSSQSTMGIEERYDDLKGHTTNDKAINDNPPHPQRSPYVYSISTKFTLRDQDRQTPSPSHLSVVKVSLYALLVFVILAVLFVVYSYLRYGRMHWDLFSICYCCCCRHRVNRSKDDAYDMDLPSSSSSSDNFSNPYQQHHNPRGNKKRSEKGGYPHAHHSHTLPSSASASFYYNYPKTSQGAVSPAHHAHHNTYNTFNQQAFNSSKQQQHQQQQPPPSIVTDSIPYRGYENGADPAHPSLGNPSRHQRTSSVSSYIDVSDPSKS